MERSNEIWGRCTWCGEGGLYNVGLKNRYIIFVHVTMSKLASKIFTRDDVNKSHTSIFNGSLQFSHISTIYFSAYMGVALAVVGPSRAVPRGV